VAEPSNSSNSDAEDSSTKQGMTAAAVIDQVVTLVIAITIALAIRHFGVEPFRIPSGSMFPTLLIGDHLFVNKLAYGPKIPFTDMRLPGWREPQRGDVVVFEVARPINKAGRRAIQPVDRAPHDAPREDFVKRLVGMPGDKVTLRNGQVFINDELLNNSANGEYFEDQGHALEISYEDLGDCRPAVLDDPRANRLDRGTWIVEEGRYFMVGDNRDNSNDSRAWGSVREEDFKGPAFILYWSWDVNGNMLSFFNPVNWFTAEKRWGRVFEPVKCDEVTPPVG
jgi:signal peptidase I